LIQQCGAIHGGHFIDLRQGARSALAATQNHGGDPKVIAQQAKQIAQEIAAAALVAINLVA
jgi:hypothetical protein